MTRNIKIAYYFKRLVCMAFMSIFVISCSKNEAIRQEVSIDDLLGESETVQVDVDKKEEIPALDSTFTSELNQKLYKKYKTTLHQKRTLLDRFTSKSVEKTVFIPFEDSTASIELFVYDFSDTTATINAFTNWLACFGNNCEEIRIDSNKDNIDETPLWAAVYEESIIVMKFTTASLQYKNELKQTVFQTKGQMLQHTLNITAEKHLKWD